MRRLTGFAPHTTQAWAEWPGATRSRATHATTSAGRRRTRKQLDTSCQPSSMWRSALRESILYQRACAMTDWEVALQLEGGGIPGGTFGKVAAPPVVFNTGMVLLGLVRAFRETRNSGYIDAISRASRFLIENQSADGAWRRFVSMDGSSRGTCLRLSGELGVGSGSTGAG